MAMVDDDGTGDKPQVQKGKRSSEDIARKYDLEDELEDDDLEQLNAKFKNVATFAGISRCTVTLIDPDKIADKDKLWQQIEDALDESEPKYVGSIVNEK
eukprot:518161_1